MEIATHHIQCKMYMTVHVSWIHVCVWYWYVCYVSHILHIIMTLPFKICTRARLVLLL